MYSTISPDDGIITIFMFVPYDMFLSLNIYFGWLNSEFRIRVDNVISSLFIDLQKLALDVDSQCIVVKAYTNCTLFNSYCYIRCIVISDVLLYPMYCYIQCIVISDVLLYLMYCYI